MHNQLSLLLNLLLKKNKLKHSSALNLLCHKTILFVFLVISFTSSAQSFKTTLTASETEGYYPA